MLMSLTRSHGGARLLVALLLMLMSLTRSHGAGALAFLYVNASAMFKKFSEHA